jgi:hypothetical protein
LLERRERERDEAFAALKKKLLRGAAQAERGEVSDGEEFMAQLIDRLKARARKTDAA